MVLVGVDESSARLRAKLRLRPPVLVAIAFCAAAILPLAVPEHSGTGHYASSALLVAIGVALAHTSLRQQRRTISFVDRSFKSDDRVLPLGEAREIALTGSDPDGLEPVYRAELVFEGGHRELLLEDDQPARVLQDLAALLANLRLPVRSGWSLPQGVRPWESPVMSNNSKQISEVKTRMFSVAAPPAQRRPAIALMVGALALGTVQAILVVPEIQRTSEISPFSVGLAVTSVLTVFLLGTMVLSQRLVVNVGRRVAVELKLLGVGLRTLAAAPAPVRGAWAVSPGGRSPRHVLIATEGGLLSVPCEGDDATALARRLVAEAR
jgi:hypothetical protein